MSSTICMRISRESKVKNLTISLIQKFLFHFRKYHSQGLNYFGFFMLLTPYYVILEPEIVKQILIQKFKFFRNNDFPISKSRDPIMSQNPFMLKDDEWKQSRSQSAPALTVNKVAIRRIELDSS